MPKGSRTTLFVSSTCYDLGQVRSDLRDFCESVGLEPVLSELDLFPVNPSQDTVSNCLEVVRNRADLFVLVVGGRYGSINESGKSFTNLEYAEAVAKGIPKYVFVKSEILALLPVWHKNPAADFGSVVDTPRLFQFVSELRDTGEVWVFPFNTAQDIVGTLRKQLSYLFADCLSLRAKMQTLDLPLLDLGPKSLRIFVEKRQGWEYLGFATVLEERIRGYGDKKLDAELGISFGPVISLPDRTAALNWISSKFDQIVRTAQHLQIAINAGVEKAVGKPGESGDISRIVHLASRIAEGYAQTLEWTLEFHRVSVHADLERLITLLSNLSSNMLKDIEV